MPLFNPFLPQPAYLAADEPVEALPSIFYETRVATGFTLRQQGLIVESEAIVRHVNGDYFTTEQGDYIARTVRVVTSDESYDVEITQTDIGAGVGQLQIVTEQTLTPAEIDAVIAEDPFSAYNETLIYYPP